MLAVRRPVHLSMEPSRPCTDIPPKSAYKHPDAFKLEGGGRTLGESTPASPRSAPAFNSSGSTTKPISEAKKDTMKALKDLEAEAEAAMKTSGSSMRAGGMIRITTEATKSIVEQTSNTRMVSGKSVEIKQKAPQMDVKRKKVVIVAVLDSVESGNGSASVTAAFADCHISVGGKVEQEFKGGSVKVTRDGKPDPPGEAS
ncbi:hypothetical protein C8J57DRAFT_1310203 [Mycena rebaudengoi]|nr:hypothetical protein C8J57DRAFT_1310203 [Mycena rebaudengoi]